MAAGSVVQQISEQPVAATDPVEPLRFSQRTTAQSTISSKFQITIPPLVRERLGLHVGEKVEFFFDGTQTVVRPVREPVDLSKWVGIARREGESVTSEDVLRELREMRGWDEWDFKMYGE